MHILKSIKGKILLYILLLVCISLLLVGTVSTVNLYNSTMSTLNKTMTETAATSAEVITQKLDSMKSDILQISRSSDLTSDQMTDEQKIALLRDEQKSNDYDNIGFVDLQGNDLANNTSVSGTTYFSESSKGQVYVTEPYMDDSTKKLEILVSAPVMDGSTVRNIIYYVIDDSVLNDIVTNIQIGTTGSAYIVDKNDITIAHKDLTLVTGKNSTIESAKTDKGLSKLSEIENKMIQGGTGFAEYTYEGNNKILAYAPISDSNGWSIGINVVKDEFIQATINSIIILAVCIAAAILVTILVALRIANSISRPIKACVDRIVTLSQGDLSSADLEVHTKDETKVLADATNDFIRKLKWVISDISSILGSMSQGDMTVKPSATYDNDFAPIKTSIIGITASLNKTLSHINASSQQVSSGAEQVSSGAQSLAQGATEQASSIEELSASINEISEKVGRTANNATKASQEAAVAGKEVENSNTQMQTMIRAMADITNKSGEIGKIIKTIDDIAFQTNILSLNAAVEAARAGSAGKGFAVVAEEVRNLANKSAEAAKITTALIEESIQAVQNGSKIADDTAHALKSTVEVVSDVVGIIDEIAKSSNEQALSITQITEGVDQISSVVQTNSATAEEGAAASEELSGQANILREVISQFRLEKQ